MKPDFALTLSFNGISLMRRVPGGWTPVGDVALDATDLRGALADLRSEADALSAHGGQVKLVIPNEQIKYLTIPDTAQVGVRTRRGRRCGRARRRHGRRGCDRRAGTGDGAGRWPHRPGTRSG